MGKWWKHKHLSYQIKSDNIYIYIYKDQDSKFFTSLHIFVNTRKFSLKFLGSNFKSLGVKSHLYKTQSQEDLNFNLQFYQKKKERIVIQEILKIVKVETKEFKFKTNSKLQRISQTINYVDLIMQKTCRQPRNYTRCSCKFKLNFQKVSQNPKRGLSPQKITKSTLNDKQPQSSKKIIHFQMESTILKFQYRSSTLEFSKIPP